LLAELTTTIRADTSFWPEFSLRQDQLLKKYDICQRQPDGFLLVPEDEIPLPEFLHKTALLWQQMAKEGYLDRAVNALETAGYEAFKNAVGDIAIRPEAGRNPII